MIQEVTTGAKALTARQGNTQNDIKPITKSSFLRRRTRYASDFEDMRSLIQPATKNGLSVTSGGHQQNH